FSPDFASQSHEQLLKCADILYPKTPHHSFPLPEKVLDHLKQFIANYSLPNSSQSDEIKRSLKRNRIVQQVREHLRKHTGVCCFFKDAPKHPLMWAHYANSHTGFCIEYEIVEAPHELIDVNYANYLPTPSISELLLCPKESFLRILTTKTIEWSYEKEIRFVCLSALQEGERGKCIRRPPFMRPVRLIKGAKFDPKKNEEILRDLNLEVVLYKNL
ncbi:MAG: DUF2971 domain-containing protein, partial [Undibacterium sp.]|nr:DUF2971 domain-containing protein [Undibacterium sp.]